MFVTKVILHRTKFLEVCTFPSCKIPLKLRQLWHCTIKKFCEKEENEIGYHRLRKCVKLHIEQAQRSKNFRVQSEIPERAAVTKGKGQNSFTKWKTGGCFQWKATGSCSKSESCSFLHSRASGNRETSAEGAKNTGVSSFKPAVDNEQRRKGKGQASSSVPTGKGRTDDKRSKSLEASPATRAKIPCLWGARCK